MTQYLKHSCSLIISTREASGHSLNKNEEIAFQEKLSTCKGMLFVSEDIYHVSGQIVCPHRPLYICHDHYGVNVNMEAVQTRGKPSSQLTDICVK